MTPTTSRRMRRSREATASSDDLLSGFDLYEIQGDSSAALEALAENLESETPTLANEYNLLLLRQLSSGSQVDFVHQLQQFEAKASAKKTVLSARQHKRNEYIMAYNRALVLKTSGEIGKCLAICNEKLKDMIAKKVNPADELAPVASRMALLLLECLLVQAVGRNSGFSHERHGCPSPDATVEWLESLDSEQDPQFKFLLALYKSRVDLAHLDPKGKHLDSNIRSARKELKSAMELFQHKLRPNFGADTGSVVSSANSEENSTTHHHENQQQTMPNSVVLQKYNQSALSLKANLEQLKGNTKKSLILCSEAQGSAKNDGYYDPIHSNNLAVVYESNDKRHLALHSLVKALRANSSYEQAHAMEHTSSHFHKDGTARADPSLDILHNSAVCALKARNYLSAYECMATCVTRSEVFRSRPRCWLRMAEACLGLFSEMRKDPEKNATLGTVEFQGEPNGVVIESSLLRDDVDVEQEEVVAQLGSKEDLDQVKRTPLLRAHSALEYALRQDEELLEPDTLTSARLSLAYVKLAFREYREALEIAQLVLKEAETETPNDSETEEVTPRLQRNRQLATARMYAAEASCALGTVTDSMKYLVGDGKEDAFDRLASDLCGVTLETAAGNGKGKRRLAKAQAMVRSSACAVTAAMGNTQAAKQLANSANAMEDAFDANRERSSARRALIYALLRDGHQSPALNLLLSLR